MIAASAGTAACAPGPSAEEVADFGEEGEGEDGAIGEAALASTEISRRDAVCGAIRPGRPWTEDEGQRLLDLVVEGFARTKLGNDRLIGERGVGEFAGFRTAFGRKLAAGDDVGAAEILRPHLKRGDASEIVAGMSGGLHDGNVTSCVGWVLRAFGEAYAELGREDEWKPILRCAEAWDSVGTRLQGALVRSGWPAPGLAIVGDERPSPAWGPDEVVVHEGLLGAIPRGMYFGAPVSKKVVMRNFLPYPGSPTRKDESTLLALGRSTFLGVGTLRAAYHVPVIVPAASLPDSLAPRGRTRARWLAARTRGEPFVLESHSMRQPWDDTNFEVIPLTDVMGATYGASAVYSTGAIVFSPFSKTPLDP